MKRRPMDQPISYLSENKFVQMMKDMDAKGRVNADENA
jgi:hypothetical protein